VRLALLVSFVLCAFSANSLLTRSALSTGRLDPASFSLIRIATGAVALWLLARAQRATASAPRASWLGAWSLAAYLVAFTLAYTRIGASVGALLMFGATQITMIVAGILRGERPSPAGWSGGALALTGLLWLTVPGATAPDPAGAAVMLIAGLCWGTYSVVGRRSRDPLSDNARNFARATALLVAPLGLLAWPPAGTPGGILLAAASGALASGVGYTVWYTVLPSLSSVRAATIQLAVPIVTALAASVLLGELITRRLIVSALFVAAGVWLTASRRR